MTKLQKLQSEAAHTCLVLHEAAGRLAQWALILEADFFKSNLPPEEVRDTLRALAHQGGRLSMAVDLSKPSRKPA